MKKSLQFNHYKNRLEKTGDDTYSDLYVQIKPIRSKKHTVETVSTNKRALNGYDDKRVAINKIETLPWGTC